MGGLDWTGDLREDVQHRKTINIPDVETVPIPAIPTTTLHRGAGPQNFKKSDSPNFRKSFTRGVNKEEVVDALAQNMKNPSVGGGATRPKKPRVGRALPGLEEPTR